MGAVLSAFCMVTEAIWPPRLQLRMEEARVKNMLPSYTLIPDDCSDSELENESYNSTHDEESKEGGGNTMEGTIRVHIKDDQQDATLDNPSQAVLHGPRNSGFVPAASTKTKSPSSDDKDSKGTPNHSPHSPAVKNKK